jgi:hypothetical protein
MAYPLVNSQSNTPATDGGSLDFDDFTDWNPLFQVSEDFYSQQPNSLNRYTTPCPQSQQHHQAVQSTACPQENRLKQRPAFPSTSSFNSSVSNLRPRRRPQSVKSAHNMTEKRYRANLNDKMDALRDSVPTLRVSDRQKGDVIVEGESQSLEASHRLTKVCSATSSCIGETYTPHRKLTTWLK